MIGYETEEQQVQAIKQFWKDNGMVIVAGAVVGLGLLWGWRYYNDSKLGAQESASVSYNKSVESFVENQNTEELQSFVDANSDTGYAPLAAFIIAQQAVDKQDYVTAKEALQAAASGDKTIADIAKLRLAKIQIQLEEYTQAITTLDSVLSDAYEGQVEELRGDALIAQGDFDGAQNAYTKALALSENNPNLEMKRDNIAYAKTKNLGDDLE